MGGAFISTLGGPPYPDGSSGVHIPRSLLDTGASSTEWVSIAPIIKLSVAGNTATLVVDNKQKLPLQSVASKAATHGGGYIVFFARAGVRMLVRIEGIDSLSGLAATSASVPYALFPHQARAAMEACGDSFLSAIVASGIVIERHCLYDERNVASTTMPASSGLLTATQQSGYSTGLGVGGCGCECNGSTSFNGTMCEGEILSDCQTYTVRRGWRDSTKQNEMLLVKEMPSSGELRLFKVGNVCSTLLHSKKIFGAYGGNVVYSCHLAIWRCNRPIGTINQKDLIRLPAEATLIWEYTTLHSTEEEMPNSYYTTLGNGASGFRTWRVRPLPASGARNYNDIPAFPLFIYTTNYDNVTSFTEEALGLEYKAYTAVCDAMDTKMYAVSNSTKRALELSEDRDMASVFSADTVAVRIGANLEQSTSASSARTYANVDHVLYNASTRRFVLVSASTDSNTLMCALQLSPLSPLWETLQSRAATASPVALDARTLESIGATEPWIPTVRLRDVATESVINSPVPFDLLGGGVLLAHAEPTPRADVHVTAATQPAVRTHTQSGAPMLTTQGAASGAPIDAPAKGPSTDTRAEGPISALICLAVVVGVVLLLFRARKRRGR